MEYYCIYYAQDSVCVFTPKRYGSTHVFLCFFPPMESVRVGAFKVRTTEQISRRGIGGLFKERFNGGQLKTFQRLSRNVRPVDAGFSLYIDTADDLSAANRDELAELLAIVGEVSVVKEEDVVRNRDIGAQYKLAREREAAGIVLGNEAQSIAERLLEFRGSGGKSQQKRKFAAALADTIAQGQKISYVAHKRRIERVEATDPEEDDSE